MKNLFRAAGILSLLVFVFFCTEKTTSVMKEMDEVMVAIKEVKGRYEEKPVESVLIKNGMVPGLLGREVDINKSYLNMKRVDHFDESLLEYKDVYPKVRFSKNYQKYIVGGNPQKKMVSFIFLIDKNTTVKDIKELLNIATIKKIKINFFIDGNWFENNNDMINTLVKEGHDLGNLSYHLDYDDSSFIWMDTIMKKLTHKKFSYCYAEKENKLILDTCSMYKNYTIIPSLKIEESPYSTIKKDIKAGSIVSFNVTQKVIKELPSIISFTEEKGYKITTLKSHLSEKK
ncbi:MAG: polysaccharide deacetylase family protein [Bacilli bacterium]|nr:polysaccharide deacetylase family protein [Bacilli bacterium]